MIRYTKDELVEGRIIVRCDTELQADFIIYWAKEGICIKYNEELGDVYFRLYKSATPDFFTQEDIEKYNLVSITFAEQFGEETVKKLAESEGL